MFSSLQFQSENNWILEVAGAAGYIQSGNNQDSDYNGNNRTLEYSRSISQTRGELLDFASGMGKVFDCPFSPEQSFCTLTPILGYAFNQQRLNMTDGYQVIPASGAFSGLNNRYNSLWQGPWLALQMQFLPAKQWWINTRLAYHQIEYSAQADWNLRSDFAHPLSFEHHSYGDGISAHLGITHTLTTDWHIQATLDYIGLHTRPGTDHTHYADGTSGYFVLNEVKWESSSFGFILSRQF